MQELRLHLAQCAQCRQTYEEYGELHASVRPSLNAETDAVIESRRDSVKAALLQGLVGEGAQLPINAGSPRAESGTGKTRWTNLRLVWSTLAAAGVVSFVFWLGVGYERHSVNVAGEARSASPTNVNQSAGEVESGSEKHPADAQYTQLVGDLRAEKQHSDKLDATLRAKDRKLMEIERQGLLLRRQLEAETEESRRTQSLLAAKTEELTQLEAAKSNDSTTVVALQYQVQDLTERLSEQKQSRDRERQLLASGREIRDIIGARNLHIIDVYDTDPEGRTNKSFARAFYTEGKSLIFYAYDLPARRTEDGKYVYTAWGEGDGNRNRARNLGILLNDDKGQKRWVLNFSDPKVLAEIDSVFITLERVGKDGDQPSGKRMLTAYLASQVNHP